MCSTCGGVGRVAKPNVVVIAALNIALNAIGHLKAIHAAGKAIPLVVVATSTMRNQLTFLHSNWFVGEELHALARGQRECHDA